ncbi:hybrid sensor histidine kinase/response regulator [Caldimonas taiwanensis]|uniref:hybrid sensor histidine kinase/response regulator n=1 Tax=Caldimonas taiwanensis TaxID=307483 RepID=UPI00078461D9|nr:response regulator [Caldimonas taiwanensis]
MKTDDLLEVLREEFALAAPDVDDALLRWLSNPDDAAAAAEAATLFDRLNQACRVVGLDGLAAVLELLRDGISTLATLDRLDRQTALGWLAQWQPPVQDYLDQPASTTATQALIDFLRSGPLGLPPDSLQALREALLHRPADAGVDALAAPVPHAADADAMSLEVPADVDAALYEAFLDDAPGQVATLAEAVRALTAGRADAACLHEARRVAHTLKGSGHIIGIRGIGRLAHRIEDVLDHAVQQEGRLPHAVARDLEQAVACLDQMVYALRGEEDPPLDAPHCLERLERWVQALHDGCAEALAEPTQPIPLAPPAAPGGPPAAPALHVPTPDETVRATLRIPAERLDRLVRRAAQALVHQGRAEEMVRQVEDRLAQIDRAQRALQDRLRDLELAIDRHVHARSPAAPSPAAGFDSLELDRYNELQSLVRFTTEALADEAEHTRAARAQAQAAVQALRKQGHELVEQHRELISARLVPVRQIVARLKRNVAQTARLTGKEVELRIEGEDMPLDTEVLDRLTEPLLHLLRNAVDHGIEPGAERLAAGKPPCGTVWLRFARDSRTVTVECQDDGRGLDLAAIHARALELELLRRDDPITEAELARLILLPGFSTRSEVSEISGRGLGLDIVADRLRAMKGRIDIDSRPGSGSRFVLTVPATTGLQHALMVEVSGQVYALPSEGLSLALAPGQGQVVVGPQGTQFRHAQRLYPYQRLGAWLGLPPPESTVATPAVVLARVGGRDLALEVDRILDSRELILQDIGRYLRRLRGVAGGAFRADGRLVFLLDLEALERAYASPVRRQAAERLRRRMQVQRKHVLVVDDALSVRQTLAQLLGDAGYEVTTARDGFEALDALIRRQADVVLTDLEMPNLDGLELTRRLRESRLWKTLPVVMLTSRATPKHVRSAEDAGVDVFLTKPYEEAELLAEVRRLAFAAG